MKRYVCTVAAGFLLALVSTGTAAAELPIAGSQLGEQKTEFGDQTVGEQKNEADVTQAQGNGNVNIAPAISLHGDAETENAQGNGNTATAEVDQSNSVDQTQSSQQTQSLDQGDTDCCADQNQAGEQKVHGGDQTVGEQKNDADIDQWQGNGNVNVSPAIALFGDAESTNFQGNGNEANADVTQSNETTQSQFSTQKQYLGQDGGSCCGGQSQTGEQKSDFGDQYVGKQKNEADVTQKQGNGNVNVSPAIAFFGDAESTSYQGNGNEANANVRQSNVANQSQSATQKQFASQEGGGCCAPTPHECKPADPCEPHSSYDKQPKDSCCEHGSSQTGEQKADFGDQYVGKQKNEADVTQKQGNGNVNVSPAVGLGLKKHESCYSKCSSSWKPFGGNAETTNYQGNKNEANANVDQSNSVDQSQTSYQRQSLVDMCKGLVYR